MAIPCLYTPAKVIYISLSDINMPPASRRRKWTPEDDELVRSILRYGVLLPVTVRRSGARYDLISGTRRFYACRRAGFHKIPALVIDVNSCEGELLAFTENCQRRSYDFVEEAEELHRLITVHGITQDEAAMRIGKSPSAVSNKLRLLNMPRELLYHARDSGLTERHVRALLRLGNSRTIFTVMQEIISGGLSVAETEKHIDKLLRPKSEKIFALGSVSLFLNTLDRAAEIMRKSGYSAEIQKDDIGECITLNITLSKKPV